MIADKIDGLKAAMSEQEGIPEAFQYSPSGDQGVIDAYQAVFGVDVVPIAPTGDVSSGFFGVNYRGPLFVNTNDAKGFLQLAGHELLHPIRRDSSALYQWFAGHARAYLRTESSEHKGRRLATVGGP